MKKVTYLRLRVLAHEVNDRIRIGRAFEIEEDELDTFAELIMTTYKNHFSWQECELEKSLNDFYYKIDIIDDLTRESVRLLHVQDESCLKSDAREIFENVKKNTTDESN